MADAHPGPGAQLAPRTAAPQPDAGGLGAGKHGDGTGGAHASNGAGADGGGNRKGVSLTWRTWRQFTSVVLTIAAFGVAVAAFSAAGLGSAGLWLIGLICVFLGILLVIPVLAGADWERQDTEDVDTPNDLERLLRIAIRAAAVVCLLVVLGIELDLVRSALQKEGFASTLLVPAAPAAAVAPIASTAPVTSAVPTASTRQGTAPATAGAVRPALRAHPGGMTWPGAFVLSVLIVAMTVIVSFTLYAIWRVARED